MSVSSKHFLFVTEVFKDFVFSKVKVLFSKTAANVPIMRALHNTSSDYDEPYVT